MFGGALFWMMYFDHKDRLRPEPRRMLLWAFVVGAAAAVAASGLYRVAEAAGAPPYPGPSPASIAAYCFGLVYAAAAHGLYDFVLLSWNVPVAAAAIALVLWVAVISRAGRLARAG